MSEALMAKGKYLELEMEAKQFSLAIEEARSALREVTAPFVAPGDIETGRVLFFTAQLIKAVEDYRSRCADMARLKKEYNL